MKTISMSLNSDLKSTELFVSNQLEKSSGVGKLLISLTSSELEGMSDWDKARVGSLIGSPTSLSYHQKVP